jgi:transcriptional regulator with XRE-family HTH domain
MTENIRRRVGARIRAARVQQGLTAAEVGECIGVSYGQIWKYEVGKSTPSVGTLTEFARVLNVPVTFFVEEIPPTLVRSNSRQAVLFSAYNRLDAAGRDLLVSIANSLAEVRDQYQLAAVSGAERTGSGMTSESRAQRQSRAIRQQAGRGHA